MIMIDCCSGLKTASRAMAERGWKVITIDINPALSPDIISDIRSYSYDGPRPDLIWFSPPCNEFAREFMPWSKIGKKPDLSIYQACMRIVKEANPRFWILENVKGAVPYFGKPTAIYNPFYLWGFFPLLGDLRLDIKRKESYTSARKAERAMIPYKLSRAVALAIEASKTLFDGNHYKGHNFYTGIDSPG